MSALSAELWKLESTFGRNVLCKNPCDKITSSMTCRIQRPCRRSTTRRRIKSRKARRISNFCGTCRFHVRGQLKFGRQHESYLRIRSRSTANGDARPRSCQVCSRSHSFNGRFRKSTAFDRNLITFMKSGCGPLTLIMAYQRPPFSTWVVSAKMHHRVPVSFAAFLGAFPRILDRHTGVSNSGRCVIRVSTLYGRCVRNSNNYVSHREHKRRV